MKFVPGKFYKTRGGSKAYFIGFTNFSLDYSCVFELFNKGVETYSSEGKYLFNEDPHDLDIISEWEDNPKKIERIVNIYYSPEKIPNVEIFSQFASKINDIIDAVNKLQEK